MPATFKRMRWTDAQLVTLRAMYPDAYARDIAARIGCSAGQVYNKAHALGLRKSEAFWARELAAQGARLTRSGVAHRFVPGQVPPNKGVKRPGWHAGRMRETQFKKGDHPKNHDPDFYVLGALRVNSDGYIDMRTSFKPGNGGWRGLHLILWEDAHGPIPRSHCLRFVDGDPLNVCLENLQLISRADNMRRNSIHNLPKPLAATVQLLGALQRTINRRGKVDEKQDRGSAQSPV